MTKTISIIVPTFNEQDNVRVCYERIKNVFTQQLKGYGYEIIFADNASKDDTVKILKEIARLDKQVKIIVNARNFGPFRSTFNALLQACGDAVVPMLACDLQDPPETIIEFVKKWEEGFEVVYGLKKKREESGLMQMCRKIFYRLVNAFSDFDIPENVGEFQLIDQKVLKALRQFDDYYPYIRGMIASCGFNAIGVEYTWKERKRGLSKNRLYHLIDQALNGIISFANVPLRLCLFFGFFIAAASILYAFIQFFINLFWFRQLTSPGMATLIVALFFFSGVQLFFLGMLGEYLSAVHFQVRKRPLVVERERVNFSEVDVKGRETSRAAGVEHEKI